MNNLRLELSRRMKLRAMDNFFKSGVWQFPFLTLNYRPLGITCYNLISFRATESKFVENILKGSLDSIPSPLVKIQIMGGKVCLRRKGKTLLGIVNKLFIFKSCLVFVDNIQHCFDFTPFPPLIWIFTEGEGDWTESRLSS